MATRENMMVLMLLGGNMQWRKGLWSYDNNTPSFMMFEKR